MLSVPSITAGGTSVTDMPGVQFVFGMGPVPTGTAPVLQSDEIAPCRPVTVVCEPTGQRWLQVRRLCAERGLPVVCVRPLVTDVRGQRAG